MLPKKLARIYPVVDKAVVESVKQFGFSACVSEALGLLVEELLNAGVNGTLDFPGMSKLAALLYMERPNFLPTLIKFFVPLDAEKEPPGPQLFCDYGYHGLPMDNEVDDILLPTCFTELWIPIARAQEVMNELRSHFAAGGLEHTGQYSFEIYGSKESSFWMSAASGSTPVVRIDIYWFRYNADHTGVSFFEQFWTLLEPYDFRLHWGKYMPADPTKRWAKYLAARYEHWDDFRALRARLDPNNIFLTAYWRERLGI